MNRRSSKESKQKILDAALKVFSRRGYARANIRDIALSAGISTGGVYLYFHTKEELYLSLIRERIFDQNQKTKNIVDSGFLPQEALSSFINLYIEYALKNKELIFIHLRDHGFTYAMDIKKRFFKNQTALLKKIIDKGIRSGVFRKCNSFKTAKMIMFLLRGTVLSLTLENERDIKAQNIREFILHGLVFTGTKQIQGKSFLKRGTI
jgi:AcrR family transcriptional regulator